MGGRVTEKQSLIISIHALREEGDSMMEVQRNAKKYFYPRPPRGGRPFSEWLFSKSSIVFLSTPSARRATFSPHDDAPRPRNFYPRPPRGGRLHCTRRNQHRMGFLSTPSARRATAQSARSWEHLQHFYPRPPRGGRPRVCTRPTCCFLYFYPRPPRGGRLMDDMLLLVDGNFYPRPPRGGRHNGSR